MTNGRMLRYSLSAVKLITAPGGPNQEMRCCVHPTSLTIRLIARAGISLPDEDRARIATCEDAATLDRWVENVLGAHTAADIFI